MNSFVSSNFCSSIVSSLPDFLKLFDFVNKVISSCISLPGQEIHLQISLAHLCNVANTCFFKFIFIMVISFPFLIGFFCVFLLFKILIITMSCHRNRFVKIFNNHNFCHFSTKTIYLFINNSQNYTWFFFKIFSFIFFKLILKLLINNALFTVAWPWFNLLRMAGWFINQKQKGQKKLISIRVAKKEVTLIQMWVKSAHWLFLKRETISIKDLINRKGDNGIFFVLICIYSQKGAILKRLTEEVSGYLVKLLHVLFFK